MSERVSVTLEVLCVLVIAFALWFIDWRVALIIGASLVLLGLQGIGRDDRTVE